MIQSVSNYIDKLGGGLSTDFQYFQDVAETFYKTPGATRVYWQVAEKRGSTYQAVQRGCCRAAEQLWSTGGERFRKDMSRPHMAYPGPLTLARWVARLAAKKSGRRK